MLFTFFSPRSVILFIRIFFSFSAFLLGYNLGFCHVSVSFLSLLAICVFFLNWSGNGLGFLSGDFFFLFSILVLGYEYNVRFLFFLRCSDVKGVGVYFY